MEEFRQMIANLYKIGPVFLLILAMIDCSTEQNYIVITAHNSLHETRVNETIEIEWADIKSSFKCKSINSIRIIDLQTKKDVIYQMLDYEVDGTIDQLIFQTDFAPNESKTFKLIRSNIKTADELEQKVYGRFVPERKDDFAWENDHIAFRMYGPALGATGDVNSGIDVWVKSVRSPIIDKWYGNGEDSYHKDHGEGLDFYKVGNSRGCGGLGIWEDGELFTSRTFKSWKIVAAGPIRFIFELTYSPWEVKNGKVSEVKRISLDTGHNLNRFESQFKLNYDQSELVYAVGLAKHEKQGTGEIRFHEQIGVLSFWEPSTKGNGNLGTGIIFDPANFVKTVNTDDHHFALAKTGTGMKATYYAGAGWDKSGDFPDAESWLKYLTQYAMYLASPVEISISGKR